MDQEKRRLRQLKRDIKRAGKKTRRGQLKRDLREKPEEAHWSEETVGRNSSQFLNRLDNDGRSQMVIHNAGRHAHGFAWRRPIVYFTSKQISFF